MTILKHHYALIVWETAGVPFREKGPCEIHHDGDVYFSEINPNSYNRRIGPSVIFSNGKIKFGGMLGLNRTDGPAVIYPDGSKEYWIDGRILTTEEFFLKYGAL